MADKALYSLLVDLKANTAQLQQDMDKAVGILQRSGRLMNNVVAGIAQGFGQAFGHSLINNIGHLSDALVDLADKGDKAGAIAENFQKIGGTSEAVDRARKAVLGTVSAFDLMKVANEGVIRGLPDMNKNLAVLAEYANRFADASGRETVEVLNALTQAISTGSNKALREFGITVDENASKSQKMAQALAQIQGNMGKLAPLTESVTAAHEAYTTALDDAIKNVGIGINDNQEFAKVYRELADAIDRVDWKGVGDGIGFVAGQVGSLVVEVSKALQPIGQFVASLQSMTKFAQAGMLAIDEAAIKARMAMKLGGSAKDKEELDRIQGQRMMAELQGLFGTPQQAGESLAAALGLNGGSASPTKSGGPTTPFGSGSGGESPAEKEIRKLKERWTELTDKVKTDSLKDAIEEAVKYTDATSFEQLKTQLSEQVSQAFIDGNKEFLKAGVTMDQLKEQAKAVADQQVKEYQDKMDDALWKERQDRSRMIADLAQDEIAQRQRLLEYYGLDGKGTVSTLSQSLQQAAQSFGSELSGQLSSAIGQYAKQIDGIANMLIESATFLGNTMTTAQAHQSGIQGPGMQNGQFGTASNYGAYVGLGINAIAQFLNASKTDKSKKDNSGTGAAVGTALGTVIGAVFGGVYGAALGALIGNIGGSMVGGLFKWGPQNKDTRARHGFSNYIEDQLKNMGGFAVEHPGGQTTLLQNFIEGDHNRFREPNWGSEMTKQSKEAQKAFGGLGLAFKAILGISEDVGDQLALMLGENLGYNVDNARHLVQRLGLTFEDVQKKLVDMGLKGEKTWLEIETGIQGASEAFKPGLSAFGAYAQGFQNLINSGARGFEAVQSVRDILIEASEKGIKNFEQLRAELLKTFDPKTVDAFFAALHQRGIASIEAGIKIDDRTAGGVVADMQAMGVKFQDVGNHIADSVGELNSATSSNTAATQDNTNALRSFQGYTPPPSDDGLDVDSENARGGVFYGPHRALMGEAGPEAILPLSRKNGKLGVSLHGISGGGGGYAIHIDARGAAPGVEGRIRAAIKESHAQISRGIIRSLDDRRGRTT